MKIDVKSREIAVKKLIASCHNDFNLASKTIEVGYNKGILTETEKEDYIDMLAEQFIEYAQKGE